MHVFVLPPDSTSTVPTGVPRVSTIGQALALATEGPSPFVIGLALGTYREKLTITRPGVSLVGPAAAEGEARLVWDDWAGAPAPEGGTLGTFRTATLSVLAPDFRAQGLTIANDWPYPGPPGTQGTQAVALRTDEGCDRAEFVDCRFEGYQDTVYANAGRQLFLRCTIEGHVDFIFGAARALFEECTIVCLGRPGAGEPEGYVCAPSTRAPHRWGLVFRRCRLVKGSPAPAPESYCLGRPWHPSHAPETVNAAVFVDCWMDDHVRTEAWTTMDSRPGGVRTTYYPEDARLFEIGSRGPGARQGRRRFVLTEDPRLPEDLWEGEPAFSPELV